MVVGGSSRNGGVRMVWMNFVGAWGTKRSHIFLTEPLSMEGKYAVKLSITEHREISGKWRKPYNGRLCKMQMWSEFYPSVLNHHPYNVTTTLHASLHNRDRKCGTHTNAKSLYYYLYKMLSVTLSVNTISCLEISKHSRFPASCGTAAPSSGLT